MKLCRYLLIPVGLALGTLHAAEFRIDPAESLIAVVTHKAGVASGLAHNHLIVLGDVPTSLSFDPVNPLATELVLETRAEDLIVDPWDLEQAHFPRLHELGVLDEPFSELSDKDREKIRRAMLGAKQLDAESHPRISAGLLRVEESEPPDAMYPFRALLFLAIKGQRVEERARARYSIESGRLLVEAIADYKFTDFGIKPYSALLGAVKNQDQFQVFVHLVADLPESP